MKWRDRRKKRRKKESRVEKLETIQEINKLLKNYNILRKNQMWLLSNVKLDNHSSAEL